MRLHCIIASAQSYDLRRIFLHCVNEGTVSSCVHHVAKLPTCVAHAAHLAHAFHDCGVGRVLHDCGIGLLPCALMCTICKFREFSAPIIVRRIDTVPRHVAQRRQGVP